MSTTTIDPATIPAISHREATELAETAYRRLVDALAGLGPDDWARPTDCEGWTVRDLAGHVLGAMRSAASFREFTRQQRESTRRTKARGGQLVDHLTALQIELTAGLEPGELVAECRSLIAAATAGRRRPPALLRKVVSFRVDMGSISERWSLGYFLDVILTRDAWLHRIDLARAVGVDPELTADHDGRIVADVVAEWARRHGQPFRLNLGGAAGREFVVAPDSAGAAVIDIDAVEFCRVVSGRAPAHGLLGTAVPF